MDNYVFLVFFLALAVNSETDVPKFSEPISNVTAPVGREATLICVVDDIGGYKVAWLRVDTQTILTIQNHVITKNHRIGISHTEHRIWYLHIREIKESDRGWYMCQINTDPMKSQVGFLEIVVPPDILDYPTSSDMMVREGSNVSMRCAASGSPPPSIMWRREGGELISNTVNKTVSSVEGPVLNMSDVSRQHMGAYLCIASNGVPPSVSKRIMLIVQFPPIVKIPSQLIGAHEGQQLVLECISEAYPKSVNYWTREKGDMIANGTKYETIKTETSYKIHMKLVIKTLTVADYGAYKCISKNSLGETDGTIKVYPVPYSDRPKSTPKPKYKSKIRKYKNIESNEIGDPALIQQATQQEVYDEEYSELSSGVLLGSSVYLLSVSGALVFYR